MKTLLAYCTCALVWGTTWYAIRVSIGPGGYPTIAAAAIRFVIASLALLPVVLAGWARPGPKGRREYGWLVLAGLLNAVGYALIYTAEEEIPGGLAAVLFGTMPLITGLLAAATRTEKLTAPTLLGALVGLAGIALISWDRLEVSHAQALGVLLTIGSVTASSSYTVLMKRHAGEIHPLATTAVFLPTTAAAMGLFALTVERQPLPWPPPLAPSIATVYLAVVGSVVAFGSYFYLVRRVRLGILTTLVFVEPVLALLIDAALEERVKLVPRTYVGAAVTLAGVLVSALWRPRKTLAS